MTDRYERIRAALAMRPTPGPRRAVEQSVIGPQDLRILSANVTFSVGVNGSHSVLIEEAVANAALAAACDPDTIRELLTERDRLAAENARLREAAKSARDALAVAIKAAWEDSTDADVAEHVVIKKLDAAIDAALAKENSDALAALAKAEGR